MAKNKGNMKRRVKPQRKVIEVASEEVLGQMVSIWMQIIIAAIRVIFYQIELAEVEEKPISSHPIEKQRHLEKKLNLRWSMIKC